MTASKHLFRIALLLLFPSMIWAQPFKYKYNDPRFNVNEVIEEAEIWFQAHGYEHGWKGFQRWRYENERRFYPSGDRSQFNPQIAAQEYAAFKAANITQKTAATIGNWTFRGPSNADNILPPSWAAGLGRVEAVWGGAASADTVYLGSRSGGFWKTLDGGLNWHSTTQDLPAMGVVDIEVHPLRNNEVWILTRHAAGYSYGLLKSLDFGETWTTTGLSFLPQQAYASELVMASADTFFVSTNLGIQRSYDGGNTWASCYSANIISMVGHPSNSQVLYALDNNNYGQLRRTTDGGQTWTNHPITGNSAYAFLATSAAAPDFVYLGSGSGIFRSSNNGSTWTNLSVDPTNSGVMALGVSAVQANHIYAGSLNQYKSTDNGTSWVSFADWTNFNGNNYMHADLRVFRAWGTRMFAGTDGFLSMSTDNGTTWRKINQGTGLKEFYRIGCSVMNAEDIVGGSQDNGTSVMQDGVWKEWIGADGMQAHFDYNNPDIWFGTIQNGNLQRSTQAGQNSQGVSPSTNGAWITPSVIDPSNENTLFIAYDSIYKSNDNGDHWQMVAGFQSGNFDEIAIAPSDSNILYVSKNSVIRRSINNGQTWTITNAGLPNQFINRIAVHPNDPMQVAVCMSGFNSANKVFASTNGGANWTNLSGNLPNLPANALVWTEQQPIRMILGMDVGVYYADMGSNAWTLYSDSLPAVVINDLEILEGAGLLRAGTWGRGVWEAPIPGREGRPQIVRVIMDPAATDTRPKPADSVAVKAVIRNLGGIQNAALRWGTSTASQTNLLAMQALQGDTFLATIPPQPHGTHVYFRIAGYAPNGDSAVSERLMYLVKEGIPCAATGAQGTTFDFIDSVGIGSLQNTSGQDYYGDFRNIYTTLYRDSSYAFTASLNYSFALDTMFLWIDWNRDGDFQAADQIILSALDATHNSFATVLVPHISSIPDTVTMRVRCVYANNPIADPCNSYFGEVEDYSLVITDPVLVYNNVALRDGLLVAPNPATEQLRISWPESRATEPVQIRILDLNGRQLGQYSVNQGNNFVLDVRGYAQGFYLLEVLKSGKLKRLRIEVQR